MIEQEQAPDKQEDKALGEKFAADTIAFVHRRYASARKQIDELQWWISVLKAFPASAVYSVPLVEAEIERLKQYYSTRRELAKEKRVMQYYEIIVTHKEGEPCPELPSSVKYIDAEEVCKCPSHLVYQETKVPIWKVREIIEKQLFYVKDIQRIRLYYGGKRKEDDCYERDKFIERKWNHEV